MNSLRQAAAGLSGVFSSGGPSYHKVETDGFEDAETGGGTRSKKPKLSFVPRLGRWSTKSMLALVGGIMVMMFLVAAGHTTLATPSEGSNAPQTDTSPKTGAGSSEKAPLPEPQPPVSEDDDESDDQPESAGAGAGGDDDDDEFDDDKSPESDPTPERRLRIILPADEPSPDLCKTVLSTVANRYPASIIVNWGRDLHKGDPGNLHPFGQSHLLKIDGVSEAIEALTSDAAPQDERLYDDDLILVMDAYDVWMQLPPEVLIRRFLAHNAAADKRIAESWFPEESESGSDATTSPPPRQRIIMSSQKKCWPTEDDGHETHCDILPQSDARPDLYGPKTDKPGHLHSTRPRYINSGSVMGTAFAMRRFFRRARAKMDATLEAKPNAFSDQGILGEILGQQEAWRKSQREKNHVATQGDVDVELDDENAGGAGSGAAVRARAVGDDDDDDEDSQGDEDVESDSESEFEFGVGLDYLQDLFKPTVFEENDGRYVVLSDQEAVDAASKDHGVDPPRIKGLPADLEEGAVAAPLAVAGLDPERLRAFKDGNGSAPSLSSWADVSLYADFWSEVVPVSVHHNAHANGAKAKRLAEWWSKNWFFPYLRDIVEPPSADGQERKPLVTIKGAGDDGEEEIRYFSPPSDVQRPKTRIFDPDTFEDAGMAEVEWDALCKSRGHAEWWEEIFQDDKGWDGVVSADGSR